MLVDILRGKFRKLRYRFLISRVLRRPYPPVLVYQMGKVASLSIIESLKQFPHLPIFHVHRINPDHIKQVRDSHYKKGHKLPGGDELGLSIFSQIIKPGKKVKVITLVREPIGRNISAYFENLDVFWKTGKAHKKKELDKLIYKFLDEYSHDVPLTWFDDEICQVLGVNVFEYDFPWERKYQQIQTEHHDILILRIDLADSMKVTQIEKFLDIKGLTIRNKNVGNTKKYWAEYKEFIQKIKLPETYVDKMLNVSYTKHFFSPHEREMFRKKWLGGE